MQSKQDVKNIGIKNNFVGIGFIFIRIKFSKRSDKILHAQQGIKKVRLKDPEKNNSLYPRVTFG